MQLNHLALPVRDIDEAVALFETHFDFQVLARQGDEIVMLSDGSGFTLVLAIIEGEAGSEIVYPGDLHVGFWVADRAAVDRIHADLAESGFSPQGAEEMRDRYGFYFAALGGLRFEVSSRQEN